MNFGLYLRQLFQARAKSQAAICLSYRQICLGSASISSFHPILFWFQYSSRGKRYCLCRTTGNTLDETPRLLPQVFKGALHQ